MVKKDIQPKLTLLASILLIYFVWFNYASSKIIYRFTDSVGLANFIMYSSTILIIWLLLVIFKQKYTLSFTRYDLILVLVGYGLIELLGAIPYHIINYFQLGSPISTNQSTLEIVKATTPILYNITIMFLGPVVEEFTFRFAFQNILKKKLPTMLGIIIIALVFGFGHIKNAVLVEGKYFELINLISYSGASIVFSIVYLKSKKIITPIALHILINVISAI